MNTRLRSHLISIAVLLIGVFISGILFFLGWILGNDDPWKAWLMPLSYAAFLGSGLIAFLIQLGIRYDLPRGRVIGFLMVIGWVAASLLSTTLDTLTFLSKGVAQGISYAIVIGGLLVLVLPGFLLMLLPWPPHFLPPKHPRSEEPDHDP
jgi:hypothetical protein